MSPLDESKSEEASAKIASDQSGPSQPLQPDVIAARNQDVWIFLTFLRCVNAAFIGTLFQPDEFYQSLEPAWQIAFGKDSGAWITWEWTHQLRSSLHPAFFAVVYFIVNIISNLLDLPPNMKAVIFTYAPFMAQAAVAASLDYCTWQLGTRLYGHGSYESWAILALTVTSPWNGFASVRTLSNSFETALTIAALLYWPWHWYLPSSNSRGGLGRKEASDLRVCFTLAAIACIIRPTNLLVWISLSALTVVRAPAQRLLPAFREMAFCGSTVLGVSLLADRVYYGAWTFPPYRFLYFNITQDLAVFYGKNRWDYYFTEGLGLLLTSTAPFALVGFIAAIFARRPSKESEMHMPTASSPFTVSIKRDLAIVALFVLCIMSLISHKEVRFIYPILPILFVLAGPPTANFFGSVAGTTVFSHVKKGILAVIVLGNIFLILYGIMHHQRGVMDVTHFLRQDFEYHHLKIVDGNVTIGKGIEPMPLTVGFLMPCHSVPWRSQLIHKGIEAWALTCEPPVDVAPDARVSYVDEADQFYADPEAWIAANLGPPPKKLLKAPYTMDKSLVALNGRPGKHEWPQKLVHFQQLDEIMDKVLEGSAYEVCTRLFNSDWHDDWRRKGNIVVRCIDVANT